MPLSRSVLLRNICPVAAALPVLLANAAWATTGPVKGQVEYVRTADPAMIPAWAPPRFWFTLKGVTKAGSCLTWASGTVMFAANDKQELAVVIAAQASGQEIEVYFDDTQLYQGMCQVPYVTIGNPAPLW